MHPLHPPHLDAAPLQLASRLASLDEEEFRGHVEELAKAKLEKVGRGEVGVGNTRKEDGGAGLLLVPPTHPANQPTSPSPCVSQPKRLREAAARSWREIDDGTLRWGDLGEGGFQPAWHSQADTPHSCCSACQNIHVHKIAKKIRA